VAILTYNERFLLQPHVTAASLSRSSAVVLNRISSHFLIPLGRFLTFLSFVQCPRSDSSFWTLQSLLHVTFRPNIKKIYRPYTYVRRYRRAVNVRPLSANAALQPLSPAQRRPRSAADVAPSQQRLRRFPCCPLLFQTAPGGFVTGPMDIHETQPRTVRLGWLRVADDVIFNDYEFR